MFLNENLRRDLFRWRHEAEYHHKLLLALAFAALTGAGAQLRLYLPFTPVPITGQVFFVLLGGVILGRNYGALSMLLYAALGALGMPWFAGGRAGLEVLLGATGGYIIGFVLAAYLVGYLTDTYTSSRRALPQALIMLAGVSLIYLAGVLQLMHVLGIGISEALAKGVLPYIPGDILKALAAAGVGALLLPRTPLGHEHDLQPAGRRRLHRHLGIAAACLSGALLLLFWLRLLSLPAGTGAGELLWYTLTYTLAIALSAGAAFRLLRAA